MQVLRGGHTLTTLQDGKSILAVGGISQLDIYTAEIYDLETNRWAFVPSMMIVGRCYHTTTIRKNEQVLIVGGMNTFAWNAINANTQLYDPTLNTFIITGDLNTGCWGHTATLLDDGMLVLVIGGGTAEEDKKSTAEVFEENFWSYTKGDIMVARKTHAAILLPNGNVLVAGGFDSDGIDLSSVEIYNSSTRTFSPAQSMVCAGSKLTLTLLPSGQVLAVGGTGPIIVECPLVSEVYNPITDQWMSTRLLNSIRYNHATILIDNTVLVIGGEATVYTQLSQCERYDLETSSFEQV